MRLAMAPPALLAALNTNSSILSGVSRLLLVLLLGVTSKLSSVESMVVVFASKLLPRWSCQSGLASAISQLPSPIKSDSSLASVVGILAYASREKKRCRASACSSAMLFSGIVIWEPLPSTAPAGASVATSLYQTVYSQAS